MYHLINEYAINFISGMGITLLLVITSVVLGLLLAIIFTAIKLFKVPVMTQFIELFLFIIRGTPFLVQLFIIYYGPLQFPWLSHSILAPLFKSVMGCAILALTLNTAGYTTALFYGAAKNLPAGDTLSAKALGLTQSACFFNIILPRLFIRILPAYINEIIMVIKCSTLTSTIAILDLMGVTKQVIANTYQIFPSLIIAGCLYFLLTLLISVSIKVYYVRIRSRYGII